MRLANCELRIGKSPLLTPSAAHISVTVPTLLLSVRQIGDPAIAHSKETHHLILRHDFKVPQHDFEGLQHKFQVLQDDFKVP
ncbi:hypothetical protein [Nostoc sp.]|uniref:hypothetical protein n=1 Tax=Nostoc sp. TaxID=1180 RepID=UPI002FFCE6E0